MLIGSLFIFLNFIYIFKLFNESLIHINTDYYVIPLQ